MNFFSPKNAYLASCCATVLVQPSFMRCPDWFKTSSTSFSPWSPWLFLRFLLSGSLGLHKFLFVLSGGLGQFIIAFFRCYFVAYSAWFCAVWRAPMVQKATVVESPTTTWGENGESGSTKSYSLIQQCTDVFSCGTV